MQKFADDEASVWEKLWGILLDDGQQGFEFAET